mgnify:CR=1 FL=1
MLQEEARPPDQGEALLPDREEDLLQARSFLQLKRRLWTGRRERWLIWPGRRNFRSMDLHTGRILDI